MDAGGSLLVRLCQWANGWTARLVSESVGPEADCDYSECVWTGGPYPSEGEAQVAAELARDQLTGAPQYERVWIDLNELDRLRAVDAAAREFVAAGAAAAPGLEITGDDIPATVRFLRAVRGLRMATGETVLLDGGAAAAGDVAAIVRAIRNRCHLAVLAVIRENGEEWEKLARLAVLGGLHATTFGAARHLHESDMIAIGQAIEGIS